MPRNKTVAIAFAVLAVSATAQTVTPQHQKIAIVGATLIDVSNYGHSTNDIADSVVLIDEGKIVAVGSTTQITIPSESTRIDAHGEFLVPGLVDGFGGLRTQAFANAYLYDGVTTVYVPTVLPNGGGDGELKIVRNASPGPRLFLGAPMTGYSEQGADPSDKPMLDHRLHDRRLSNQQLIARVDQLADQGFRGVTISYDVWPDQVDVIVAENKRRGTATLAEPAFTTYPYAIHAGVSGLLRNDHYLLELAPPAVLLDRADNLGAGSAASRAICTVDPASNEVADFGAQLAKSNTALMPTLSMEATADALDVPNPWSAPSAALIKAADLDDPVDPSTGESAFLASLPRERRKRVRDCAWHKEAFDARLYQLGAKYLAGSSATSYGIMPGSGLHLELTLLHRIGLSPREAIAAATSNFADIYGWRDIGRIEPGRVADVLILNADPRGDLAALDHIDRIIFRGAVLHRQSLLEARGMK
jgi:Amidohydrolase family